jgi:Mg2+-importing ATPase
MASRELIFTSSAIMAFGIWLPYTPLASSLGLVHLPGLYWPILVVTLFAYMALTQAIKVRLLRKHWI